MFVVLSAVNDVILRPIEICPCLNLSSSTAGVHKVYKNVVATPKLRRHKIDKKQFPCWGSTNIRRPGGLAPVIRVPLM